MTEKRFIEPYEDCRVIKNIQTGETATYYDTIDGLMFLKWLNNLSDENEQLKKLTLYFLSCATGETSSNYDKDMDIWCNEIFGCNYQEADKKYGDDESIWELGNKIFKEKEE